MMRVITGLARGKKLNTLEGMATRPTSERAKEAVFSSLFEMVNGANVLDLFAGSGQMGIEAVSRGAAHCTFVEQAKEAVAVVSCNIMACGFDHKAGLIQKEALSFLSSVQEKYDLIFMDPPYGKGLLDSALTLIENHGILRENGIVVAESDEVDKVGEEFGRLRMYKRAKYGRAVFRYYGYNGEEV